MVPVLWYCGFVCGIGNLGVIMKAMENIPFYINASFILTTLLAIAIFYRATNHSRITLLVIFIWLALQSILALSGFYKITNTVPPRFILLILPPLLFIAWLFLSPKGKTYLDRLNPKTLILLHLIRILVEIVLFSLFLHQVVPEIMTFRGWNFDILSGLTAPFIFYFYFIKKKLSKKAMLLWNIICLGLLLNIVILAVLSAPFPFQKFGFDQPNIAVLYFPFIWLPCCVVPLVLISHLAVIRHLSRPD